MCVAAGFSCAVGDRRLVAVVSVGDQQRHVDRQLAGGDRPDAGAHAALVDVHRRLAGGPAERRLGVVQQEDRLELGASRPQEPQPALLRPGMRALVGQHLAGLVRASTGPTRRSPRASARRRPGRRSPARPTSSDSGASASTPRRATRRAHCRLLGRVGQRQVHDVVRAAREVGAAGLVVDHVVGRRDERRRAARRRPGRSEARGTA